MNIVNLEAVCAEAGRKIIKSGDDPAMKDQENVITKALGVLVENGLYAMSVYLLTCNKKEYGKWMLTVPLRDLWASSELRLIDSGTPNEDQKVLDAVLLVTKNLGKLMLCRKVTEQALVFARYHAKADIRPSLPKE